MRIIEKVETQLARARRGYGNETFWTTRKSSRQNNPEADEACRLGSQEGSWPPCQWRQRQRSTNDAGDLQNSLGSSERSNQAIRFLRWTWSASWDHVNPGYLGRRSFSGWSGETGFGLDYCQEQKNRKIGRVILRSCVLNLIPLPVNKIAIASHDSSIIRPRSIYGDSVLHSGPEKFCSLLPARKDFPIS